MVSFSCENCGDVLTKKKLDPHRNQCRGASFTCLDCMVHFNGTEYRAHTSCISEAQKHQGALYKEKKPKPQQQKKQQNGTSQALVPRKAYVEDAPDQDTGAVAIVDAPPHAPSPPPAAHYGQAALPDVNVFDFLVASETPNQSRVALPPPDECHMIEDDRYADEEPEQPGAEMVHVEARHYEEEYENDHRHYAESGFTYGAAPIEPSFQHYDSYADLREQESEYYDSAYYTPAPKPDRDRKNAREMDATVSKKSDKKRKRQQVEDLDMALVCAQAERDVAMADAPPVLHSGLTGGLNRLLTRPDFPPSPDYSGGDYVEASPLSPIKRAKQSTSKALARVQRQYELEEERERKRELEREREKERGRDREPKSRKVSGATTKETNGKSKALRNREDSGRDSHRTRDRRRRRRASSTASPEPGRKPMKAIEYHRAPSASPGPGENGNGALILHSNGVAKEPSTARAELFMSFVTKGPESERGCSVNKALKRYHRERYDRWDRELGKGEEEKELWKSLRLRRNDRGEVVLFF